MSVLSADSDAQVVTSRTSKLKLWKLRPHGGIHRSYVHLNGLIPPIFLSFGLLFSTSCGLIQLLSQKHQGRTCRSFVCSSSDFFVVPGFQLQRSAIPASFCNSIHFLPITNQISSWATSLHNAVVGCIQLLWHRHSRLSRVWTQFYHCVWARAVYVPSRIDDRSRGSQPAWCGLLVSLSIVSHH